MAFITLENFIKKDYQSSRYQDAIPFARFRQDRISQFGYFEQWLDSFKGEALNAVQWKSIARSYIDHGNRKHKDIPPIIASISRKHDIEIPAVEGILTTEYWERKVPTKDKDSALER